MLVPQLSIFLENKVGQLSELTGLLRNANINLNALNIAETADYGIVRIIVDRPDDAKALLTAEEYIFSETPVVLAFVENRPGGLDDVLKLIAAAGISIEYMYSIFGSVGNRACMAFRVDDPERLTVVLREHHLNYE